MQALTPGPSASASGRGVSDPNRADDPEYIVRLVERVVRVSLETVKIVRELAALPFSNAAL